MRQDFRLPDAMDLHQHVATGLIRLQFIYDGDETVSVFLDQSRVLSLLVELQAKTEHATITPISPGLLREGQKIRTTGLKWEPLPHGRLQVSVQAKVEGREVTIPLSLSSKDVSDLRRATER